MMRSKIVKRLMMLAVMGVLAVGWAPTKSYAFTELGDMCWQLSPFVDTLALAVAQDDNSSEDIFWVLAGRWRAIGVYQAPVTGHVSLSDVTPGMLNFAIAGAVSPDFFGGPGIHSLVLYATLDPVTLSGPFNLKAADTGFTNSGTMNVIDCSLESRPNTGIGPAGGR